MPFTPSPNESLAFDGTVYAVAEHPSAPRIAYGQEGRQGVVYQLVAGAERRALKAFKPRFRSPAMVSLADRLAAFADLPGLAVCRRTVLGARRYTDLLRLQPDLTYAVLMPWIDGPTWAEIVVEKRELTLAQSHAFAASLLTVLTAMEERGVAHCDLSGPNIILPGLVDSPPASDLSEVVLVDVEQLFGPGLDRPEQLPGGSPGYAHRLAATETWDAKADRFTGALLLVEILGWCDEWVRGSAWGESYFDPAEMQSDSSRYYRLLSVLRDRWGDGIPSLFERAWQSETLADCATFGDWLVALPNLSASSRTDEVVPTPPVPTVDILSASAPLIHEARRLEESGDLAGAIAAYEAILERVPSGSGVAEEVQQILLPLRDALSRQVRLTERGDEAKRYEATGQWPIAAAQYESLLREPGINPSQRQEWEASLTRCQEEAQLADLFDAATLAIAQDRLTEGRDKLGEILQRRPNGYIRNDVSTRSVLAGVEKRLARPEIFSKRNTLGGGLVALVIVFAMVLIWHPWSLAAAGPAFTANTPAARPTVTVVATEQATTTPAIDTTATAQAIATANEYDQETVRAGVAETATSEAEPSQTAAAQLTASAHDQATATEADQMSATAQAKLTTTFKAQVTPTLTPEPSATPLPSTATPLVPTPTPRPPPPTPFPATSTPVPTAVPAAPLSVPAPVLNPASYPSGSVLLSWSYSGQLASDEYFDVRVWKTGQPADGITNTKQTTYTIGGSFSTGTYNWTIAVIENQGGTVTTLAQAAQVLQFTWQPASSGSSGGGGGGCRTPPNC